jgi:hypothetical protein
MTSINSLSKKLKDFSFRCKQNDVFFLRRLKEFFFRKKENFLYLMIQRKNISKSDFLGVTYDDKINPDGAGAQLQRIYGIYAISRLLGVVYVHTPLFRIDYQGLAALESNSSDQDIVYEYNKKFHIPSDINLPERYETRYFPEVSLQQLMKLKKEAEKKKIFILAKIQEPYKITDAYPEHYEVNKEISPFLLDNSSSKIRIAVHIRRGELYVVDSHRMLPNQYYISVIHRIREILDSLSINYEFELYTEVPQKAFTVSPQHHGIKNRIPSSIVVDPKFNRIEEFDSIPNLKKFINTDPIETLTSMSSAHILVMSHSSFSYLGAILNRQGIIVYHNFWHKPLKQWLIANDSGHFSENLFMKKLMSITHQSNLELVGAKPS